MSPELRACYAISGTWGRFVRVLYLLYGIVAYALFLVAIVYAIGFVGNLPIVPKGIDEGAVGPPLQSLAINVGLLLLFAVQHNVMARSWFKDWWTRFVPRPIERSTYVLVASLILVVLYWQWRPMPTIVWQIENGLGRGALWAFYALGWAIVLYSSFVIDHFELFGLKQVWMHFVDRKPSDASFSERSIYKWVRHPLMLGFIVSFWSAPTMTQGRLLFAVVTTAWILLAIRIEERDLAATLGDTYAEYRRRTPMLLPIGIWRRGND